MKIEIKFGVDRPEKKEWHDYWLKITIRRKEYDTWVFITKKWVGFHSLVALGGCTRKDYGFLRISTIPNHPGNQLDCIKKDTHKDLVDSTAYMVGELVRGGKNE